MGFWAERIFAQIFSLDRLFQKCYKRGEQNYITKGENETMGRSFGGFLFELINDCLQDSKMISSSQRSRISNSAFNDDNLAVRDENGKYLKYVSGNGKGDGYYISTDGRRINEWDLYEHMSEEDDEQYDAMYGVGFDDEGNAYLKK